jgi:hypothetical protein
MKAQWQGLVGGGGGDVPYQWITYVASTSELRWDRIGVAAEAGILAIRNVHYRPKDRVRQLTIQVLDE